MTPFLAPPRALLLDVDGIRLLDASGERAAAAWNPDAPDAGMQALRAAVPQDADSGPLVLVVGLGLLDVAQPELPPLEPSVRRAVLLRDADRYFPVSGAVAVSWTDGFAFAAPADRLVRWVQACEAIGPARAVTSVVECVQRAAGDGNFALAAGAGEAGSMTVKGGRLTSVRRLLLDGPGAAPASGNQPDDRALWRGATAVVGAPLSSMLLDAGTEQRLRGAQRFRWLRSAAVLVASLGALAYSADRWRAREAAAADAAVTTLESGAAPAQAASARLERAQRELSALDLERTARADPAVVLARLGALLPRDAFIHRLDWDGSVWRIDGSANDAPRIVPVLDADSLFADVRIVAASTRFIDAGRQRESFSISFRTREPGGPRGAQ